MTSPIRPEGMDITAAPRAALRGSVRLLYRVFGEELLGSASANAQAAVRADRQRARDRADFVNLIKTSRHSS